MTLTEKIAEIDEWIRQKITRQCDPPQINYKAHGRVKPLYSQQDKRILLLDSNLKKVTVESTTYDFQGAHVLDSGRPKPKADYGQFEQFSHELHLFYLGVSKSEFDFVKVLQCFEKVPMVSVLGYSLQSEQIIRDDWRTPVNDDRNYNPNLFGFKIEYTLQINVLADLL
jgi:hypothetical protein